MFLFFFRCSFFSESIQSVSGLLCFGFRVSVPPAVVLFLCDLPVSVSGSFLLPSINEGKKIENSGRGLVGIHSQAGSSFKCIDLKVRKILDSKERMDKSELGIDVGNIECKRRYIKVCSHGIYHIGLWRACSCFVLCNAYISGLFAES